MKRFIGYGIIAIWLLFSFTALEARGRRIYIRKAPPSKKVIVIKKGPRPHARAIWMNGYWHWNGKKYVRKNGHWIKPRKGFVWVPGHWVHTGQGWYRIEGHWKRVRK